MAEEHGVFGPALVGAELLGRASILSCHQLLGHRVAVDAGVTVFPPVFSQFVSKEELTAWKEGKKKLYVTANKCFQVSHLSDKCGQLNIIISFGVE